MLVKSVYAIVRPQIIGRNYLLPLSSFPNFPLSISTSSAMPPKGSKRKTASTVGGINGADKRVKHEANGDELRQPHPFAKDAEDHGIVLRRFYPQEMSTSRAHAYNSNEIARPMEELIAALEQTAGARKQAKVQHAVVHWFKMDLRHSDNRSLALASAKAKEAGVPLICVYIISPQDFEAHLTAPVRVDFMLRTLSVLRDDLAALDIPLYVETVDKRKDISHRMLELMEEWGSNHLFANMEYEVDELRREARMIRQFAENNMSFEVVHDTCVVPPGELHSGSGKQYAVYTPWYRSWMAHIHENLDLLEIYDRPEKNPDAARRTFKTLFDCQIPDAPKNKQLSDEERKRFHDLWPCGEHEAKSRLDKFCEEAVVNYHNRRNIPGDNGTSCLSVHLASGTISSRTCVRTARDRNKTKRLDGGHQGLQVWISEIAWRDFYKHVLVNWPYVWYV